MICTIENVVEMVSNDNIYIALAIDDSTSAGFVESYRPDSAPVVVPVQNGNNVAGDHDMLVEVYEACAINTSPVKGTVDFASDPASTSSIASVVGVDENDNDEVLDADNSHALSPNEMGTATDNSNHEFVTRVDMTTKTVNVMSI